MPSLTRHRASPAPAGPYVLTTCGDGTSCICVVCDNPLRAADFAFGDDTSKGAHQYCIDPAVFNAEECSDKRMITTAQLYRWGLALHPENVIAAVNTSQTVCPPAPKEEFKMWAEISSGSSAR